MMRLKNIFFRISYLLKSFNYQWDLVGDWLRFARSKADSPIGIGILFEVLEVKIVIVL